MNEKYRVGDLMTREVHTISPETKLLECAQTMASARVGSLVVIENKKVVGMITEQDLARKVLAQEINVHEKKVKDVMSAEVTSITPDRDIHDAVSLMGINEVKHLPVLSEGTLHGIITFKDIIKIEPALIDLVRFKSSR